MKSKELIKDLVAMAVIAAISITMMLCNPENQHVETNSVKENQNSGVSNIKEETKESTNDSFSAYFMDL